MNKLLKETIHWNEITYIDPARAEVTVQEAFLHQESKALHLLLRANFVLPEEEELRVCRTIREALPDIAGVTIVYNYDRDGMITEPAETLAQVIRQIFRTCDCPMKNAVKLDTMQIEDSSVRIASLGEVATEELNRTMARTIAARVRDLLGRTIRIEFCNDETRYAGVEKAMEEHAQKVLAEAQAEVKAAEKKGRSSAKKAPAEGQPWNGGGRTRRKNGPVAYDGAIPLIAV